MKKKLATLTFKVLAGKIEKFEFIYVKLGYTNWPKN